MNNQHNGNNSPNHWCDFNNADEQMSLEIIPKGTLAKVRMTIKPGGYDDPSQGITGGFATCSKKTGAIYLNCEFVVLSGQHVNRKVQSLIGLHSEKGDYWGNSGRTFIKAILSSARNIAKNDTSPAAQQARQIADFSELNGIEFVARIDVEKDDRDYLKNVVKVAITPEHKEYVIYNGGKTTTATTATPARTNTTATPNGAPPWQQ